MHHHNMVVALIHLADIVYKYTMRFCSKCDKFVQYIFW